MRGVEGNARHRAIAQSVAYLAHALDVETVAEGIETDDQLRCAHEMGFTNVQGFVLIRPVPAAQVLEMMRSLEGSARNGAAAPDRRRDRTSGVWGKGVYVRVHLGVRRSFNKHILTLHLSSPHLLFNNILYI